MRNSSLLAGALLLSVLGCQPASTLVDYAPLDNLPPKTDQRVRGGGLGLWALAEAGGKVQFYLLPPKNGVPEDVQVRFGGGSLKVERFSGGNCIYFAWVAQLGKEGVLNPLFRGPMIVEVRLAGGEKHCVYIAGLGTDSYPVLHMCYFDLNWEAGPCN